MGCGREWRLRWGCEYFSSFCRGSVRFWGRDANGCGNFRVAGIEAVFLYRTSWERSVEDATRRNDAS